MVRGLFPQKEQTIILDMLERSVVFLSPATIYTIIKNARWLSTAWNIANIYLASLGAKTLTDDTPTIIGMSEETAWYVSMEYLITTYPFDDFMMHKATHIFHNSKREII